MNGMHLNYDPATPAWDRLSKARISNELLAAIEKRHLEKEQEILKECTFRPAINPLSAQLAAEKQPRVSAASACAGTMLHSAH